MTKRYFLIVLTLIYVCVGLYVCFTPGYTYKATRLFYKHNIEKIEDYIAYKESNGFPKCNDVVIITLPDERIEICRMNQENIFCSFHDTTNIEYRNTLNHLGVTQVQLNTLISKLKNIGVNGVYITRTSNHFLLSHGITYRVVSEKDKAYHPLDNSEIGSRMEIIDEVRCNSYSFLWLLLYPYTNALNLN